MPPSARLTAITPTCPTAALAGFKYLVEYGRPYDGKAGSLPRPQAYC